MSLERMSAPSGPAQQAAVLPTDVRPRATFADPMLIQYRVNAAEIAHSKNPFNNGTLT
jgi:hypothetical protein